MAVLEVSCPASGRVNKSARPSIYTSRQNIVRVTCTPASNYFSRAMIISLPETLMHVKFGLYPSFVPGILISRINFEWIFIPSIGGREFIYFIWIRAALQAIPDTLKILCSNALEYSFYP